MKATRIIITAIFALAVQIASAQQITIKATKVSRPLVEQWIKAYSEVHPEVTISTTNDASKATLSMMCSSSEISGLTYVGRLAVLPVTSAENPLIEDLTKKELGAKEIKRLFFENDELEEDEDEFVSKKSKKLREQLTVYSGSIATSVSGAFAEHFGQQRGDIRGKKIAGDDLYLLSAISEDKQSITFNSLAYLFDLQSRQLKQGIAILPLNVKKDQAHLLYNGNLDEALALLETQNVSLVPIENIAFDYQGNDSAVKQFIAWVASEGQQYNHNNGFLKANNEHNLLANK